MIVLSHMMISHHHHDTVAYKFSTIDDKIDEHKHHDKHDHHHDSNEENNNDKDTDQTHNHSFPFHHHFSATNYSDFTRVNLQVLNSSNQSIHTFVYLVLIHTDYSEPPSLTNYNYGEPPFLINSHFEPWATASRGPPYIV